MLIEAKVGPIATTSSIQPTTVIPQRAGNLGEVITSRLHGDFYEQTYRGNIFLGANATPSQLTTGGLSTSYRGLCLYNPIASLVNLVILKVGYSYILTPLNAFVIGLMCGNNTSYDTTHSQLATTFNGFIGGVNLNVANGIIGMSDTLTTLNAIPTITHIFDTITSAPTSNANGWGNQIVDLDGAIILSPGSYCAFYTSADNAISGFQGSFCWEEVSL